VTLAPLEMSVPAADGLLLKGTLTYPEQYAGAAHAMAIYFDVRDELLRFLRQSLDVQ
jgi:hypothetical protein